jgi:hypothetical protein
MARPLPKPHGRPQGAGGGRGASRPDSLSATTTDALFAGKVQRKVSNGIAGLAAAGSSRHRQKIVPIPASASKGGRTPRTLYRSSNGALRSPAGHCACGYDGNSRARNPRKNTSDLADSLLGGAAAAWPLAARNACFSNSKRGCGKAPASA